jgi:hypothetical protein
MHPIPAQRWNQNLTHQGRWKHEPFGTFSIPSSAGLISAMDIIRYRRYAEFY